MEIRDREPSTKQGREIATRMTKSGVCECRPRQSRGSRAERELVVTEKKEEVEVEGETAMDLYMPLGPLPTRFKRHSNSNSAKAASTNYANKQPCFLMQNHQYANN